MRTFDRRVAPVSRAEDCEFYGYVRLPTYSSSHTCTPPNLRCQPKNAKFERWECRTGFAEQSRGCRTGGCNFRDFLRLRPRARTVLARVVGAGRAVRGV